MGPTLDAYYVDFLCVDKQKRKQGIAPALIQTHEYNQRRMNRNIVVSLFKREGELTGIVPVCVYQTYGYNLSDFNNIIPNLPIPYNIIEIGTTNIQHLYDFTERNRSSFSLYISTEMGNMMELIKTGNIFVFLLVVDMETQAAFFFRKSCTFVRKGVEIIHCFASICENKDASLLTNMYRQCLQRLQKKNPRFQYITVEDIADNHLFIDSLGTPDISSPTAYFFYNFAYPTFSSQDVFVFT